MNGQQYELQELILITDRTVKQQNLSWSIYKFRRSQ